MHTLVTFLGRTARPPEGYPAVSYEFDDGSTARTTFVGYSLAAKASPKRLVVMGTKGSMWDQLITGEMAFPMDADFEALMDAVERSAVTQAQLDVMAPALAEVLDREVVLRIIPDALQSHEQIELLMALAEVTTDCDEVSLDITHGYRHLPMLIVMAAMYLRALRPELQVRNIWYAALRPNEGRASVHDLVGLLHISDWLSALRRSEISGDYSEVAKLIDDPRIAEGLLMGGFNEMIHQGQRSRSQFRNVRRVLAEEPLDGAGALFQPLLEARTAWVEEQRLYQRQRAHAMNALARGDLLRAALFGYEAHTTKLVHQFGGAQRDQPNDREVRKRCKDEYESRGPSNSQWRDFKKLRGIRNVLAHGNQAENADVQQALRSPASMELELTRCLNALLPENEHS